MFEAEPLIEKKPRTTTKSNCGDKKGLTMMGEFVEIGSVVCRVEAFRLEGACGKCHM